MIIDKVTITGADDATDINDLLRLSKEFPYVEWGILLSLDKMGAPRYPKIKWIEQWIPHGKWVKDLWHDRLLNLQPAVNLSLHVCGQAVRDLLEMDLENKHRELSCLMTVINHFPRVQLNFNHHKLAKESKSVLGCGDDFAVCLPEDRQYIFQVGKSGDNPVMRYAMASAHGAGRDVSFAALFDRSGGRGETPEAWPAPLENVYCGYAGGLGPDNIEQELKRIENVVPYGKHIWVDMESNVRGGEGDESRLDLEKVRKCLAAVRPYMGRLQITI